jgi:hypothetical protein
MTLPALWSKGKKRDIWLWEKKNLPTQSLLTNYYSEIGVEHFTATLIEETFVCPSFFLVLRLTNNNKVGFTKFAVLR